MAKSGLELDSISRGHLFVHGRVQGVCFRAFTEKVAKAFGLLGTSENIDNDKVEIIVEGHPDVICNFARVVHYGPSGSRVNVAELTWEPATGIFTKFDVICPPAPEIDDALGEFEPGWWHKWFDDKKTGVYCPLCHGNNVIDCPEDKDWWHCKDCRIEWLKEE